VLIDGLDFLDLRSATPFLTMMLSLLKEGYWTDNRTGEKVDFTQTVIVITSHAQHQETVKLAAAFPPAEQSVDLQAPVKTALENKPFAPEWLARVQLVTTTQPLTSKGQAEICGLHLKRLADQHSLTIDEKGVDIKVLFQALDVFKKFEGKGVRDPMR
jgi:ATP-dependent Clp protease ATP-binding subunit ClpA